MFLLNAGNPPTKYCPGSGTCVVISGVCPGSGKCVAGGVCPGSGKCVAGGVCPGSGKCVAGGICVMSGFISCVCPSLSEMSGILVFCKDDKECRDLKVLAKIPYLKFHFFPYLLIFLQFRNLSCVLNLSIKAVLQKHIQCKRGKYLQFELIFCWALINPGRVFLEMNHLNLDFLASVVNLTILMAVSYYFFNSKKPYFLSFKCTTHNKTKIVGN